MATFDISTLLPMSPVDGPPLPRALGIYWPWHKAGVELDQGWNKVVYTGPSQKVEVAFNSIKTYLIIAYYWNGLSGQWVQLVSGSQIEPNMSLNINVTAACTWTW